MNDPAPLDAETMAALVSARHPDPFALLGPQPLGDGRWGIRALLPDAETAEGIDAAGTTLFALHRLHDDGLFAAETDTHPGAYRLRARRRDAVWEQEDAYRFGPVLSADDEHFIAEGTHQTLWRALGAHPMVMEGVAGVGFAVWAPSARRVAVVGEMNGWDGRRHGMRRRGGLWEIFLPGAQAGQRYKYEIRTPDDAIHLKADPVGFGAEHPPETASVIRDLTRYRWPAAEAAWRAGRKARNAADAPIAIYEVHLPSWRRGADGRALTYRELAETLIPYVRDLGFTHIETLPLSEYPFGGSWGYQPVGLYAPTSRHGTLDDFRAFVAACHNAGLGLILDWPPGHFPADPHGLARFDGTALYEHADPREGVHKDWDTLIYHFGRTEVRNFLIANALYWLREYGVDGLRVDAVASMLYRDYSRAAGEWVPNIHGGRENLEAIAFLKAMNSLAYRADDTIMTVAEESTAWPGVTQPAHEGGLGFGYKWNMGWMNDTLEYMAADPVHRAHDHHKITFGLDYAFSENFILALSHDEVVHGKGSLYGRMPGDHAQKLAHLRAYYAFMWGHPGKKLLFMGGELAQVAEWNHDAALQWGLELSPGHAGMRALIRDLNRVYRATPALHRRDGRADGFQWVIGDAAAESVFAWLRYGEAGDAPVLCLFNMTPVERAGWRIGVPEAGYWAEILNSDAEAYGGENRGNYGGVESAAVPSHGFGQSITVTLPPLSGLYLQPQS